MKRTCFLYLAFAVALAGGCGRNDHDRAAAPAGSAAVGTSGEAAADVKGADKDFVRDVAIANIAELDMARLALQRGTDANLKKFAQMMIDDHTQAGTALKSVASRHRIEVPAQTDEAHQDKAKKLGEAKAGDFDREYADAMVDGHQDVVNLLEPRIDRDTLSRWKSKNYDPNTGKKIEAKGEAVVVMAEKSDNPITASLNQWAAETYPVAFAHLQAAKDMQKGVKRRSTTP